MKQNPALSFFISILLLLGILNSQAFSQETIEEKLVHIEAKLDSIINLLNSKIKTGIFYETITDTMNLRYGITSPQGTILDKEYFIINHNDDWKIPYWVAYYLSSSNLQANTERTDDFRPDPELKINYRSELRDYQNSGYDRGHNAPAAAFKRSIEAMSTTFLLSNMSPQTPKLNRQMWKKLEVQIRDFAMQESQSWIITGNIFMNPDSIFICPREFIGSNQARNVAVPTHCFKAILSRDTLGNYSMYAFLLPNQKEAITGTPSDYQISIEKLEEITGYDFFPILDDNIEIPLESSKNAWPQ